MGTYHMGSHSVTCPHIPVEVTFPPLDRDEYMVYVLSNSSKCLVASYSRIYVITYREYPSMLLRHWLDVWCLQHTQLSHSVVQNEWCCQRLPGSAAKIHSLGLRTLSLAACAFWLALCSLSFISELDNGKPVTYLNACFIFLSYLML